MYIFKIFLVAAFLLTSISSFAVPRRSARQLSWDYKLNSEDVVIAEFNVLKGVIYEKLGHTAWSLSQNGALAAIRNRDFRYFDPLVRDTSCELRALFGFYVDRQRRLGIELSPFEKDFATFIYILSHALTTDYGEDGFGAHYGTPLCLDKN